jgi:hypothetical protein
MHKSLRAQTLHYFARPHERIPLQPVQSPAAWRGADMRKTDEWIVQLTPAEIEELQAAQRFAQAGGKDLGTMSCVDFPLPTLAARIDEWRDIVHHGRGFLLIRGVPVETWSEAQSATFFWCLGQHLGIPGAQNPEGDLLGHVRDQRTGEDVRYYRTNKEIAVHCDAADMVGLLCLQPAKSGGLSRIVSSVAVYNELLRTKPHLAPRLFEPLWFDTKGEGGVRAFPITPCHYGDGVLRTFWQSDYYRSAQRFDHVPRLTAEEQALLDAYDQIANSPEWHLDMELQQGDVQLLSNHTQLHARTAFEDFPEPERRRHLLRLWISVPERRELKSHWRRGLDFTRLVATAARELYRERRRGFSGSVPGSMGAGR